MINFGNYADLLCNYLPSVESSLQLSDLLSIPVSILSQWELQDDHTSFFSEVNSTFGQVSAAQGSKKKSLVQSQGYNLRLQSHRNKLMHALNGNTVLRLNHSSSCLRGHVELQLEELIPHTSCRYSPQEILQHRFASFSLDERHTQSFRSLPIVQTTPQFHLSTPRDKDNLKGRSGRRRRYKDSEGVYRNYKPRNGRRPTIRINSHNSAGKASNTAATRHAGSPTGANEECTPRAGGGNNALKRGAKRRRLCRQSYRR